MTISLSPLKSPIPSGSLFSSTSSSRSAHAPVCIYIEYYFLFYSLTILICYYIHPSVDPRSDRPTTAGLSLKTQVLTALFLVFRLYCSLIMEYDIHTVLDTATLVTTLVVIFMIRFELRSTYMADKDTISLFLVVSNFYFDEQCIVVMNIRYNIIKPQMAGWLHRSYLVRFWHSSFIQKQIIAFSTDSFGLSRLISKPYRFYPNSVLCKTRRCGF